MGRIVALANQKGGVGKTTSSVNLSAALARMNKKVLLVDMDPQGNATVAVGVDKEELELSAYDLLSDNKNAEEVIVTTNINNLSLIGSNIDLTTSEVELLNEDNGTNQLKKSLKSVKGKFDIIIIDCPPSLNMLTINSLVAADGVLVPVQCEFFALEGLSALMDTISVVQEDLNPELQIDGLLRTMHDRRNNLANDVSNELVTHFGMKVLKSIVPRNVRLAEAPSHGESILDYDINSNGAAAYLALANELIRKTGI